MTIWSRLKERRNKQIQQRRQEAYLRASAGGATPEEARKAADRAENGGTNAAIMGAINS
ncbi:hypothetical protein ACWDXH_08810 [Micromonospora chokoriensis]|uniref:hypothetical protein n=1 Tax=Micromonospora sp. WMMD964 TaxID=3016091 RepID=UPI00249AFDF5|nr:hypothetical protein [Micromonospora sp. WMMD964]WFF00227.1 hypothetical protein O7616_25540 [Micromonospora sp. WMMD964]